jgi:hypothetical protein
MMVPLSLTFATAVAALAVNEPSADLTVYRYGPYLNANALHGLRLWVEDHHALLHINSAICHRAISPSHTHTHTSFSVRGRCHVQVHRVSVCAHGVPCNTRFQSG